jgi:hypothetical protein
LKDRHFESRWRMGKDSRTPLRFPERGSSDILIT